MKRPGAHRETFAGPLTRPSGAKRAFTLIELLVVIAIIVILAALLLPSLSRARSGADAVVCRNNLRQIHLGSRMYIDDFGCYVPVIYPAFRSNFVFDMLTPYTRASGPEFNVTASGRLLPRTGLLACPGYNRIPGAYMGDPASTPPEYASTVLNRSGAYAYNLAGLATTGDDNLGLGGRIASGGITRESDVLKPADMIEFGDSTFWDRAYLMRRGVSMGNAGCPSLAAGVYDLALRQAAAPRNGTTAEELTARKLRYQRRHSACWNVAFCDGHAEYRKPSHFFDVIDRPDTARRWNIDNEPHLDEVHRDGGG